MVQAKNVVNASTGMLISSYVSEVDEHIDFIFALEKGS